MSERPSRKIHVISPHGRKTHEIRLTQAEGWWQARVVTLPNQIWVEPGQMRALRFTASTAEIVERIAAEFVERDVIARGHRLVEEVKLGAVMKSPGPARRRVARYMVILTPRGKTELGAARRTRSAVTHNLSETGLFVITDDLLARGTQVVINLRLPGLPERLEGDVVWTRAKAVPGSEPGIGIRLIEPPLSYVAGIQRL